jgi:ribosomal-protein-alanine N-acetyltransferase
MTDVAAGVPSLRALGPFDLAVAAAIHGACFDDAWDEASIAELLAMPGSFGLLAAVDGDPGGLAVALALGADVEILTLAVPPTFRRRGIARLLLAGIADRCIGEGRSRLLLEVAEDNAGALALYRGADFVEVGRRPGYYRRGPQGTAAAIVLARALPGRSSAAGPDMRTALLP